MSMASETLDIGLRVSLRGNLSLAKVNNLHVDWVVLAIDNHDILWFQVSMHKSNPLQVEQNRGQLM